MKKYILLFGAGSMLALASCGGGETKPEESQQAIDSAVNAKMQVKEAEMKAYNDSIINAAAIEKAKADSIKAAAEQIKASGGKSTGKTSKPSSKPTPPPPPPTPAPQPVNPKAARFGDEGAKQQQQEQSTNKKADRFNK